MTNFSSPTPQNRRDETRRDETRRFSSSHQINHRSKGRRRKMSKRGSGGRRRGTKQIRRPSFRQRSRNQESHSTVRTAAFFINSNSLFFFSRSYIRTYIPTGMHVQRQDVFERSKVETFACFLFLSINDWIKFNTALLASYYYT